MGEKRNTYILLVGKPERKRLLERPRRRWMDNIRMDLGEVEWSDVDCIGLAQDRSKWRVHVNYRVASQLVASRIVLSSI
jgi:hypothetical protein